MTLHHASTARVAMALALAAAGLAACGGGGGGTATATVAASAGDKYVGTWFAACVNSGSTSTRGVSVITKVGANLYALANRSDQFGALNCTGSATAVPVSTSNFQITGTSNVRGVTVDRVATPDFTGKDLLYLSTPTTFQTGDPASGRDVDDYPTSLSSSIATKQ